VCWSLAKCAGV